ncbi:MULTISPECIES: EAL domain-containing protein [Micromonospora]|uniref:EAL domain-containing protein n=1 Tax=Micromonospora TaxID=1873 RepID=UPI000C886A42|nr:EAL domain-containing protein [Verrucosispora sp. ts21]PMR63171.1 diguanylate phosphodiesterase [Verrucosispora sp. ts21]
MATAKRWAVLIGVNESSPSAGLPALQFAENDAREMDAILLDEHIGTFEDGDVHCYAGVAATWPAIKTTLREIAIQASPSDVLLVYFAGHSFVPEWSTPSDAYLVTADFDPEVLVREPDQGLRMSFLRHDVFEVFAGTSLLVLDCCQAGDHIDVDQRHTEVMRTYYTRVDRHSALLSCQSGVAARESTEHQHGMLTHHILRALRGAAQDERGQVSFAKMADFVAQQDIEPPPVRFIRAWGSAGALTRPPVSRHDRGLNKPATAGSTWLCRNPLEDQLNSILQFLARMFPPEPWQIESGKRLEIITAALAAESAAMVTFTRNGYGNGKGKGKVSWTERFDEDYLRPLLELAAMEAIRHRTGVPGYGVSSGGHRLFCVPVSVVGDATLALAVVDPPLSQLDMGEPLAVMLRAICETDPLGDPVLAEMLALTALRSTFGRLPLALYERAFRLYEELINSIVMVFQPVVELDRRPSGVSVHSYEALARRGDPERGAPVKALNMARVWGDRFIIERDVVLARKAIHSYAKADTESEWQGTKPLSINVAVRSLLSDSYLHQVTKALDEANLNPRVLTLEISEQDPIEPAPGEQWPHDPLVYFHSRLTKLTSDLGISFAMDDFGVGHASLARMAELHLTQIKVDRAVLQHPMAIEELELVVQVAGYARTRGQAPNPRAVILEGFDDEAPLTLQQVYEVGIHHVQGYFSGQPGSATLRPLDSTVQKRIAALVSGEQ